MARKYRCVAEDGLLSAGLRRGTMKDLSILDMDFDEMFLPVDDLEKSDIDQEGNLDIAKFVTDELLAEEGIPLTCEEVENLFGIE